ncbi:MAG TPA: glycosyltransferase [Solirubrobacteraceae bacterium]|nr:glycosyltransferase [Solirubrobacteraceae bacterium]
MPQGSPTPRGLAILVDRYPVLSETFVREEAAALARAGVAVRIEAIAPGNGALEPIPGVGVSVRTQDSPLRRLRDLLWLLGRHPRPCARDLRARARWRREEPPVPLRELAPVARRIAARPGEHIHAHFLAGAALDAQRIGALLERPHSVTAHAYDIWLTPRNLHEKLRRAAIISTGCDYNVRGLREIEPPAGDRVHRIVMGVDARAFQRRAPVAGRARVLAVGRLVEKKGFDVLLRAAARLPALERVEIVGEGPERGRLERLVGDLGLDGRVRLLGALAPAQVRERMLEADVLAAPSVVAADGDRDSMPVVVKEAMALELLVAASAEVGLPECVRPPWGRLAPPRDDAALAAALAELIALELPARRAAGAAGRRWVIEHADPDREARRLLALLAGVGDWR